MTENWYLRMAFRQEKNQLITIALVSVVVLSLLPNNLLLRLTSIAAGVAASVRATGSKSGQAYIFFLFV